MWWWVWVCYWCVSWYDGVIGYVIKCGLQQILAGVTIGMLNYQQLMEFIRLINLCSQLPVSKTIQKIHELMESDPIQSRTYIEYIFLNSHEFDDSNLKAIVASYLGLFVQDRLMLGMGLPVGNYGGTGGIEIGVNCWCGLFKRIIDNNKGDYQPYKSKIVEIYTRTILEINEYGFEQIHKMVQTVKYYMMKKRPILSFYMIQSLLNNPRVCQLAHARNAIKKFKHQQLFQQIILLLIDTLTQTILHVHVHVHEDEDEGCQHRNVRLNVVGLEVLLQGLGFWMTPQFVRGVCGGARLGQLLAYALDISREVVYADNIQIQHYDGLTKILNSTLQIGKIVFRFLKQDPSIPINNNKLLQITQNLYHLLIQKNPLLTKHPPASASNFYINSSAVALILQAVEFSSMRSCKSDGQKLMAFHGNTQYVFGVLLLPLFQGFRYLYTEAKTNQEKAQQFINMFLSAVFNKQRTQQQQQQEQLIVGDEDEPILIAYIRLITKLCECFQQLRSTLSSHVRHQLEPSPPQSPSISQTKSLENSLILNSCLCSILSADSDWIILMENLPYRLSNVFEGVCLASTCQTDYLLFLYLLCFRVYIQDIFIYPNSDAGVIPHILHQLCHPSTTNQLVTGMCMQILQKYYSSYQFPYKQQQPTIHQILSCPNPLILQVQLTVLKTYNRNVGHTAVISFIQQVTQTNLPLKQTISIYKQISNILQQHIRLHIHIPTSSLQEKDDTIGGGWWLGMLLVSMMELEGQISRKLLHAVNAAMDSPVPVWSRTDMRRMLAEVEAISGCVVANSLLIRSRMLATGYDTDRLVERVDAWLVLQLGNKIKLTASPNIYDNGDPQINSIFQLMEILPKCPQSTILSLWNQIIRYFNTRGFGGKFQSICQRILILQVVVERLGWVLEDQDVLAVLPLILTQVNRRNRIIQTDKAYFYRGKLYTLFIMLMKLKTETIREYLLSLQYQQLQQNFHPVSSQQTLHNLMTQIFCTPHNYVPHYDLPLAITYVTSLLADAVRSQSTHQHYHHKYLHLYMKLLVQGVERLEIWWRTQEDLERTGTKPKSDICGDQVNYMDMETHSCYQIVISTVKQASLFGWKVQSVEAVLRQFIKVYTKIKEQKSAWLAEVSHKFINPKSIKLVEQIIQQECMGQPVQKYKNRRIVSIKKQY